MVRGNIVENRIGEQIAGAVAVAEQIADEACGNRQRRHVEGQDAARRALGQLANIEEPASFAGRCQFGGEHRRPAAAGRYAAGTAGHGDVGKRKQFRPAMPTRQAREGIGAEDELGPSARTSKSSTCSAGLPVSASRAIAKR